MERPVFVVLRKGFHSVNGVDVAFCPDGMDVRLFFDYAKALEDAKAWCECNAHDVEILSDCGELSRAAAFISDLCAQVVGSRCSSPFYTRVGAVVYQKYVIS